MGTVKLVAAGIQDHLRMLLNSWFDALRSKINNFVSRLRWVKNPRPRARGVTSHHLPFDTTGSR